MNPTPPPDPAQVSAATAERTLAIQIGHACADIELEGNKVKLAFDVKKAEHLIAAHCAAATAKERQALPADLATWTSTIRWMLNVSEDRPYTQAATLFDKVTDTKGVPHRGHLEALWSWLDELAGRPSGATGTPTYKIPCEIRNSMEDVQAKLQRTIDRELDKAALPPAVSGERGQE